MAVQTNIDRGEWFIGSAFTFRVLVTSDGTSSGTPVDMTSYDLTFNLRQHNSPNATAIISKTSGGGTIAKTNVAGTKDAADVTILASDHPSASFADGKYDWVLWRTDGSNDRPLAYGTVVATIVPAQ